MSFISNSETLLPALQVIDRADLAAFKICEHDLPRTVTGIAEWKQAVVKTLRQAAQELLGALDRAGGRNAPPSAAGGASAGTLAAAALVGCRDWLDAAKAFKEAATVQEARLPAALSTIPAERKKDLGRWIIKDARIVFCTMSKSGNGDVAEAWSKCSAAIIDEAAMVLESETHIVLQVRHLFACMSAARSALRFTSAPACRLLAASGL